ncbi:MAG: tetratricopeptide repeat protein [Bacteroidales bacterium]|nr:tetratricopeptide repeat protein [Bacteroidales bacterium]
MRKFLILIALLASVTGFAQVDKKDVRRGNRQFAKAKYGDADISYRKALNADSTSVRAAYDLGNNLYRQGDFANAGKYYGQALRHVPEVRNMKQQASLAFDTYFNAGDAALQQKQYRAAMESFVQALLIDPDDMEARRTMFMPGRCWRTIRMAAVAGMMTKTRIRIRTRTSRTRTRISRIRIRTSRIRSLITGPAFRPSRPSRCSRPSRPRRRKPRTR